LFMPHFDAALLVVEDGKNTADEIRRSLQILEDTELMGIVLNKSEETLGEAYYPMNAPHVAEIDEKPRQSA